MSLDTNTRVRLETPPVTEIARTTVDPERRPAVQARHAGHEGRPGQRAQRDHQQPDQADVGGRPHRLVTLLAVAVRRRDVGVVLGQVAQRRDPIVQRRQSEVGGGHRQAVALAGGMDLGRVAAVLRVVDDGRGEVGDQHDQHQRERGQARQQRRQPTLQQQLEHERGGDHDQPEDRVVEPGGRDHQAHHDGRDGRGGQPPADAAPGRAPGEQRPVVEHGDEQVGGERQRPVRRQEQVRVRAEEVVREQREQDRADDADERADAEPAQHQAGGRAVEHERHEQEHVDDDAGVG